MPEVNKRYDTPHLNRYGISRCIDTPRPQSKQEMSAVRRSYFIEIFQISYRELWKHFLQYVTMRNALRNTKIEIYFQFWAALIKFMVIFRIAKVYKTNINCNREHYWVVILFFIGWGVVCCGQCSKYKYIADYQHTKWFVLYILMFGISTTCKVADSNFIRGNRM